MATENPRVWFKSISLENVRSFGKKQTIYFTEDGTENGTPARWNVILGDNGTGKTTVLRGIVSVFNSFGSFNHTYPLTANDYFLRDVGLFPKIQLSVQSSNVLRNERLLELKFVRTIHNSEDASDVQVNQSRNYNQAHYENFPLFGYGADRRIGVTSFTSSDDGHVGSLIFEGTSLSNAEEWLIQADYLALKDENLRGRFTIIIDILQRLLRSEVSAIRIDVSSGTPKVFFKTHYGDVRLHELSLGYKTLIAWMVDFAKGLLDRYPDSTNPLAEPAVCLVDEIDLHLHPKFQRTIIKFLTETFPNTQFIVTAHSPLIVQSAGGANIIVLRREGDETVVDANQVDVHDWRIDQILSSDIFGGIGGRSPDVEEKIRRRRSLLRKNELIDSEKTELALLEQELGNLPVSESREALKALDIISQSLISQS